MNIYYYPHPILNYKCKQLKKVDAFIVDLITRMREVMELHNGVGLSANQVGYPYCLFITKLSELPVIINPVISREYGGLDSRYEGCLSLPGINIKVRRNNCIKIEGFDLKGNKICLNLKGLPARICQHEVQHLRGKYILDDAEKGQEIQILNILNDLIQDFTKEEFSHEKWFENIKQLEMERC